MSKEILKGIFEENIAPVREDITFEGWVDKIKDNEEYKAGLFENYVQPSMPDATFEEFNSEAFGSLGKVEAPLGGAQSEESVSPTESVSSEFEVGPPGVEPKGVEEAAALVGDVNGEPPIMGQELGDYTIVEEDDRNFFERLFGEERYRRVTERAVETVPALTRLFGKAAAKGVQEEVNALGKAIDADPEFVVKASQSGLFTTNNLATYLSQEASGDKKGAEEINMFLEKGAEGKTTQFQRFKTLYAPIEKERNEAIQKELLSNKDYVSLRSKIDAEFNRQRVGVDEKYDFKSLMGEEFKAGEKELLNKYESSTLSLPMQIETKANELKFEYQAKVNSGQISVDDANEGLRRDLDAYSSELQKQADKALEEYNSGVTALAERLEKGVKDKPEFKAYMDELTELRNGVVESFSDDYQKIQQSVFNNVAPKYNSKIESAITNSMKGETPLLDKSGVKGDIEKIVNNRGWDYLAFDQKRAALDTMFGTALSKLKRSGVEINDGVVANLRAEFDDAFMDRAYFTKKGTPSLFMVKTRAIEEAERLDEMLKEREAKTGTKTYTSGIYGSEFGVGGRGYDDTDVQELRLAREKLQEIIDMPETMSDSEWSNFWNGFTSGQVIDYLPFVSGLKNLSGTLALYRAVDKDTESARYLKNAEALNSTYRNMYEVNNIASDWYKAGKGTAQSLPFMMEFAATAGVGSGVRLGTEKVVVKLLGKQAETMVGKSLKVMAGTLISSLAQTTLNPQRYVDETLKRMTPQMTMAFSPEGDDLVAMLDSSDVEGGFEAALKGFGVTASEYFSEGLGFAGARAMKAVGSKMLQNEFLKRAYVGWYMSKFNFDTPTAFKKIAEMGGWNGFLMEFGEELANIPLTNLITGDAKVMEGIIKDGELDTENLADVARTLLPISLAGGAFSLGTLAISKMSPEGVTIRYRDINNLPATETINKGAWDAVTEVMKSPSKVRDFIANELPRLKVEGKGRAIVTSMLERAAIEFDRGIAGVGTRQIAEATSPTEVTFEPIDDSEKAPKVEIIVKRRQKLNKDRTKLVPTGGFDYFAKVGDKEVKLSDAEYKAYKESGVLPESVSAVEATPEVEGEAVAPEEVAPKVPALRDVESTAKDIESKRIATEAKIKRKDLFIGVGEFSTELGGSDKAAVPISHKEKNGIEFVEYAHPETGSVDVIVTGKSDNDFVGFYRIYENGKPTNKWSSKFENQSRNKEDFKTMISGVQEMLPARHEYTEKTSISTDGLRVWNQQLERGYELQYDKNGKLITNSVFINGDAIVNELGVPVEKGNFERIKVTTREDFEKVKANLLPYLEKFGLDESSIKWISGNVEITPQNEKAFAPVASVKIDLPVLKKLESLQSKEQEAEGQPTQTPEAAEGQPAEVVSPEVAEALSTEDATRIALESLEVLPEGIESAEEGARIYHEAIGKDERTEAEEAVVAAVEDAVIGSAVAPEVMPEEVTPEAVTPEAEVVETAETPKAAEGKTEEPSDSQIETKIEEVSTTTQIRPNNLRDLYKVNRELFGQNKIKALASAIAMDRMVGAMAKRSGITKAEMYGRLKFEKASEENLPEGVRLQVDAWHGSPYQFDKFSLEKIGTGEGAQAFGWGLYFSDLEGVGRGYAESLSNRVYLVDGIEVVPDENDDTQFFQTVGEVAQNGFNVTKERALSGEYYSEKAGERILKNLEKLEGKDVKIKPTRNLYKVSLQKGKAPSEYTWLQWDKPFTKEQIEKINKQYEKENLAKVIFDRLATKTAKLLGSDRTYNAYRPNPVSGTGEIFYRNLVRYFVNLGIENPQKEASLFLLRAGIEGIRYPAESISRGATSDTARGFNYVVFDESAISIEEVIKFQKDANKARGAVMVSLDGQAVVYALTDPNVSTPLHEMAHIFEHYLTPSERNAVIRNAGTNGWTTETSEYFARGFERYLAEGSSPIAELNKVFAKFREWLVEIYNGIVGSDIDIELNPEMRKLYDTIFGETAETPKPAEGKTLKEKKADAKRRVDEATAELQRLNKLREDEMRAQGIDPFGKAQRLAEIDKERLKEVINLLKARVALGAYSFADFVQEMLNIGILIDPNSAKDRAFFTEHTGIEVEEEITTGLPSIGITNAYDKAVREAKGLDPIAKAAKKTNAAVWDEAMESAGTAQSKVEEWARQEDGFVPVTPINQALILFDRIRIENEREILLKELPNAASNEKKTAIYARLAELEIQTESNEIANAKMGRTWGASGIFRQALANRAYTLTGIIARAKAISGNNLSSADEVKLAKLHSELDALRKENENLQKRLAEEIAKERIDAQNRTMAEARRKPLAGTTTKEDVKSAYQKWLAAKKGSGIMFDPKSQAEADIEFLGVLLDYLKSQAANTISKVRKAVKDFSEGELSVDDAGAAFILEEMRLSEELAEPTEKKPAEKKPAKKKAAEEKLAEKKAPAKKIKEKNTTELVSDIIEKAEGEINEMNIDSLRPYFAQVIRNEVAAGAKTFDEIVQKVYDELSPSMPSLTFEDLKDAMSGYGVFKELSKEDIDVKVRELKRIGRLEAALRDVVEKLKLPKKTGVEQDQLSTKARDLRRQILKAISDLGITPELTDEELAAKWQSARDAYARRLDNAIKDVQLEIDNKEKKQKKEPRQFDDDEIRDLRDRLAALRDIRDNIDEIKVKENERKIASAIKLTERKIAEAETKLATGDLSVKEKEKLSSPELDALREKLKGLNSELAKAREEGKSEIQRMSEAQARLDSAAKREINRLQALRQQIIQEGVAAEDVTVGTLATIKKKKKFPGMKRADALQQQIDALKRDIDALIPSNIKEEALAEKYLAGREKVLERLEKKLADKDFAPKKRPVPPLNDKIRAVNSKIRAAKDKIDEELERIRLKNRGFFEKLGDSIINLLSIPKTLIASVDLSAPGRQGIVYAITEPKIFLKAFKDMFRYAFSQKSYDRWLEETKQDPRFDEYTNRYKLFIADQTGKMNAREELFMSRFIKLLQKIPLYGQLLKGSERAYVGFINKLRWDVFQKYVSEVEAMGLSLEETDAELKAMANLVNTATGRGKLPKELASLSPILNSVFFSPRLIASRLHPFMLPFLYKNMPKAARKKAAATYLKFFGGMTMSILLLSLMLDEDEDEGVELDPRSSDFLKLRWKDYRLDLMGGYQQAIVAVAKLIGGIKSTKTQEVKSFSDEGFGQQTREDIIANYFTNKLSPVPSAVYRGYINPSPMDDVNNLYNALFGEVPKEERTTLDKFTQTLFELSVPLYLEDMVSVMSDPDSEFNEKVIAGSSVFGLGASKYGGKTILTPNSPEFRTMRELAVVQPRFNTEVKINDYKVSSDGRVYIDKNEEGKEVKKTLTQSQLKKYNEILKRTYTEFVRNINVDFKNSLTDEEKVELAKVLLNKAEKISEFEYIMSIDSSVKEKIEPAVSNLKEVVNSILLNSVGVPFGRVKSDMERMFNNLSPNIDKFEDIKENE